MRVRSGIHCAVIMCYVASAGPAKQFRGKSTEKKMAHFFVHALSSDLYEYSQSIQSCAVFIIILYVTLF